MPDVAFDSERHAQVSDDIRAGGGELTTSAMSATVLAPAQVFGHWTTESAAQVMGETVRSFPIVVRNEYDERSAVLE